VDPNYQVGDLRIDLELEDWWWWWLREDSWTGGGWGEKPLALARVRSRHARTKNRYRDKIRRETGKERISL